MSLPNRGNYHLTNMKYSIYVNYQPQLVKHLLVDGFFVLNLEEPIGKEWIPQPPMLTPRHWPNVSVGSSYDPPPRTVVPTGGLEAGWSSHGLEPAWWKQTNKIFLHFFFTFSERLKGFEFHKDELENCRVFLFELFFLKTNKVPHLRKRRNKHGWEVTFHVFEPLPQSIIPTALVKLHRAERDEDFPWNIYHDVTLEVVKKSQHSTQNLLLKMIYMRNGWAQNLNQISVLYCCFFLLLVN